MNSDPGKAYRSEARRAIAIFFRDGRKLEGMALKQLLFTALLLAPASAHSAPLKPAMEAKIAAIRSEGEGTRVTEELLRKGDKPGTATQRRLQAFAAATIPYLDASVSKAPWNDSHMGIEGPSCFDAAPKFGLMLRAMGMPGWVASCAHHVFVIAETPEATLLIDPTIRQYFGHNHAPAWVPKIFVGTLSELKALYSREPGLPVLPYNKIYFDPEWPAQRRDSKMLSARGKFLRSTQSKEHAPLTGYFNRYGR